MNGSITITDEANVLAEAILTPAANDTKITYGGSFYEVD